MPNFKEGEERKMSRDVLERRQRTNTWKNEDRRQDVQLIKN